MIAPYLYIFYFFLNNSENTVNTVPININISDILNDYINVKIYKNNGINILNNSKIFSKIVCKHIDEIRVDVTKAIDSLKEELSSIVK